MRKTLTVLAATALATLFVASSGFEPAAAQRGDHGRGPSAGSGAARSHSGGGNSRSYSGGGVRSYSGGRAYSGSRQFSRTFRSPSVGSRRVYADRGHHRRQGRHFRGGRLVYGVPFAYGYNAYSDSCYWLRQRALETGSSYWWNRYYDCLEGYGYY